MRCINSPVTTGPAISGMETTIDIPPNALLIIRGPATSYVPNPSISAKPPSVKPNSAVKHTSPQYVVISGHRVMPTPWTSNKVWYRNKRLTPFRSASLPKNSLPKDWAMDRYPGNMEASARDAPESVARRT